MSQSILSQQKYDQVFAKDDKGNFFLNGDSDLLLKYHAETYVDAKSVPKVEDGDRELLQLFKEENESLKIKIIEISQQIQADQVKFNQLQKENQRYKDDPSSQKAQQLELTVRALEEAMSEKDHELKNLRVMQNEYAEIKAKQLL